MDTVMTPQVKGIGAALQPLLAEWWPVLLGMLVLFVPSLYDMANTLWSSESYAHGPIILVLSLWLLARRAPTVLQPPEGRRSWPLSGWLIMVFGLLLYVVGRSQGIQAFELGSLIVLLAGGIVLFWGGGALKTLWFPLFFMLFMVPLPGSLVSLLTMPMKMAVSYVTEHILFLVGYPIARSGVVLQIGQYQLLVADACAGLQTLLTLEALGLFYLNVVQSTAALRNVVLAILIIPISFTANVIRVMTLTLITYYFGDAAGQGFMHGFAGMLLFISALVLIISLDTLLQWVVGVRSRRAATAGAVSQEGA